MRWCPRPRARHAAASTLTLLAVTILAGNLPLGAQSATTAFVGATVLPMDSDRVLRDQTVLVRDGRIAQVGPAAQVTVPAGAARVDARGKFLMPGLAEMHAHVPPQQNVTEQQLRDIMFLYIANGVTTIRGMLGAPYQLELRERLARGEMLGPTFYVGAPSINGNSAPTPDSARALVRAHRAAGYDFLKVHPGLSRPVYDAMVVAANEVGITWAGHVSAAVGIDRALETRQGSIDHLDGYFEGLLPQEMRQRAMAGQATEREAIPAADVSRIPALARRTRDAGVWNVPTAFLWESFYSSKTPEEMAARPEMRYVSRQQVQGWSNQKRGQAANQEKSELTAEMADRLITIRRQILKGLADAGAPLLMGTDSPQMFNVPGFALHREIGVMREAGLTCYQVLESGTRNIGRYVRESLRVDHQFGTIAAGQRADLILLEANPLDDLANLQRRAGVMVRGRWVPEADIQKGLEELAGRMAQ